MHIIKGITLNTHQQLLNALVKELEPDDSERSEWKTYSFNELLSLVENALEGSSLEKYNANYRSQD